MQHAEPVLPFYYSRHEESLQKDASTPGQREVVERIHRALIQVSKLVANTNPLEILVSHSESGEPVTTLDRAINHFLHSVLPEPNEGWLSEETCDDLSRLSYERVWVVDPIDGTREFIEGIPEWCVSIACVERGEAVAGGILNPTTGEVFLGSRDSGVQVLQLVTAGEYCALVDEHCMLVSRREHQEGKWKSFDNSAVKIQAMGSIAYRLARVAAGQAAATCTFQPRSEWDVAAGVALVEASGGRVHTAEGREIRFNNEVPRLPSFFAFAKHCSPAIPEILRAARTE